MAKATEPKSEDDTPPLADVQAILDHHARVVAEKDARIADLEFARARECDEKCTAQLQATDAEGRLAASEARVAALEGALRREEDWWSLQKKNDDFGMGAAVIDRALDQIRKTLAAAVPQPPPKQLADEQFNDKFFDEMVRQGSPDPRRRISNVTKVYPMGQDEGPAVPQGEPPDTEPSDEKPGVFIIDPIEALLQCAVRRWPALNVRVQFSDEDIPDGALGLTSFPPAGEEGPAIISVRPDLAGIGGTIDILAHELAHAATGTAHEEHGAEWKAAYDGLHDDFVALDGFMPLRCIAVDPPGQPTEPTLDVRAALAAQPAPASPPRDERPLPPQWKKREWQEGWMYRGPGEDQHVFVGKDDSVTAADTNATTMLAVLAHHFGAPTVSRGVDEAAVRARFKNPHDAATWVLSLYGRRLTGCSSAPLSELYSEFRKAHEVYNASAPSFDEWYANRTTERPAASGKDGAT